MVEFGVSVPHARSDILQHAIDHIIELQTFYRDNIVGTRRDMENERRLREARHFHVHDVNHHIALSQGYAMFAPHDDMTRNVAAQIYRPLQMPVQSSSSQIESKRRPTTTLWENGSRHRLSQSNSGVSPMTATNL